MRKKLVDISVFFLLFLSSGFAVLNDLLPSSVTIFMWVVMLLFCYFFKSKISYSKKSSIFIPIILIIISYFLSSVLGNESIFGIFANVFTFIVAFSYVMSIDISLFKASFVDVIKILCLISLVGFFSISFIPVLKNILSPFIITNKSFSLYYNFFVYTHPVTMFRNQGMFWEPGAFQAFINIALLLELKKEKPKFFNILLFVITIITTFSTTGYVAMVIVLLVSFFNKSKHLKKTRKYMYWIVPALVLLSIVYSSKLTDTSSYSTFGKLQNFADDQAWERNNVQSASSTSIRWYSVVMAVEAFIEKPLTGWGSDGLAERNYDYTYGMNTCTYVNWFAKYGIIYGLTMLIGFIYLSSYLGYGLGRGGEFLIFLFFFIATISEEFSRNCFFLVLCLYGYLSNNNKEVRVIKDKTGLMKNNKFKFQS